MSIKEKKSTALIMGWAAVILITVVACFWAFWETIENFHEGWWYPSIFERVGVMFIQYLSFPIITVLIGIIAIRWPKIGGGLLLVFSIWFIWAFIVPKLPNMNTRAMLSWFPMAWLPVLVGILFLFGRPQPRKWAYLVVAGAPLLVSIICAVEPIYRISGRIDDGNRGMRLVEGNGLNLIWAPAGPGWVREASQACSWQEARRRCRFLTENGKNLAQTPQNIWRLPTVDEVVRSMMRHGRNCKGRWDPEQTKATYEIRPDKESPLWDTNSGIIYWWTDTEADEEHSFFIVYHGKVYPRKKTERMGSRGFRAVREVKPDDSRLLSE
jgi:hypothetical protein